MEKKVKFVLLIAGICSFVLFLPLLIFKLLIGLSPETFFASIIYLFVAYWLTNFIQFIFILLAIIVIVWFCSNDEDENI